MGLRTGSWTQASVVSGSTPARLELSSFAALRMTICFIRRNTLYKHLCVHRIHHVLGIAKSSCSFTQRVLLDPPQIFLGELASLVDADKRLRGLGNISDIAGGDSNIIQVAD